MSGNKTASSPPETELEKQLLDAGNKLLEPPSSVDELLPLLDQVESFLSKVEQSPSKSMLNALNPSIKALVVDELLTHSNTDVKVAVASCISEITRITAPDAPYDDDKMKDVFQLIVASFENLADMSNRSYNRRVLILETVAKVRSCVVMLDLECDELIIKMLQHFLKAIRDSHPENVFESMETIMTLVLDESEEISLDMLTPILSSLKMDEEIQPISRKLAENVVKNCALKVKPYLLDAVKSLEIALNGYSKVLSTLCEVGACVVESDDHTALKEEADGRKLASASSEKASQAGESTLATSSSDGPVQAMDATVREETCPQEGDPVLEKSPKSRMSNGVSEEGNHAVSVNSEPLKSSASNNSAVKVSNDEKGFTEGINAAKVLKVDLKAEKSTKKRGRKPEATMNSKENSDSSLPEVETEEKVQLEEKSHGKDVCGPSGEDSVAEATAPGEGQKEVSLPKGLAGVGGNADSPSASGSLPSEHQPKKVGRPKKKEKIQEEKLPAVASQKSSEKSIDSEGKVKRSAKKAPAEVTGGKSPASGDISKDDVGKKDNSELKQSVRSDEQVDGNSSAGDDLKKKKQDGSRRGRGKASAEKDVTKTNDEGKEKLSSLMISPMAAKDDERGEDTPKHKHSSKRKLTLGSDKKSVHAKLAENLVGLKVKVWWPKDRMFYEGVIESFDPDKKKHKVVYTDGDIENLNLKTQRWELIDGEDSSDADQEAEHESSDALPVVPRKKRPKANFESSSKRTKAESSPKIEEAAATKSKGASMKSGQKSRDDASVDVKSREKTPKASSKVSQSQKSGNSSVGDISKKSGKPKDVDSGTPKTISKSKGENTKTTPKSSQDTSKAKAKSSESSGKSNANGISKVKFTSSKAKQTDEGDKSPEAEEMEENTIAKQVSTPKKRESGVKVGKKRRRASKS